ncbi:MAG: hypothetical protein WAV90_01540 [Gordonia amarae]
MRTLGTLIALLSTAFAGFMTAGAAHAAPDVRTSLIAAGVPADVAGQPLTRKPAAAGQVIHLTNPNVGMPASSIDAVVDHKAKTVQVIQRYNWKPSQLSVAWVNLSTGASGRSGFPTRIPRPDLSDNYYDLSTTLRTGPGPVALVVWGMIPGWTGLLSVAPEYFGILTPTGTLVTV